MPPLSCTSVLSEGSTLLQDLLRKYLLENTHKLSVHLRPDAEYTKKREAQEAARLAEMERSMQEDDFARIAAEAEVRCALCWPCSGSDPVTGTC